ncbi:MAG: RNA 3'-terminal phosphate cyclase [Fibrobacter sp.]|nr:RNA 3'-terminal phosphate cyclase [Fibrobacter sp.]
MITIDGSQGEGGGQILRTALTLSLITGQPFKIINIRAGRSRPGLMRQHLTAVDAAVRVGNAEADGASIGSKELIFKPGSIQSGTYNIAIGTAGSVTLVLQTILPALLLAKGNSALTLEGGTHNPFAPPWDFLSKAFLPVINRMGPTVHTDLHRYGFYPAGGGRFSVNIQPAEKLTGFEITERGEITHRLVRALVANIPLSIGHRECRTVSEKLNWSKDTLRVEEVKSSGPGNAVMIEIGSQYITEVFTGFGERGNPAETVASNAAEEVKEYLESQVPVGIHLADQLMLPFALAGSGCYVTMPLTQHSNTNLEVIGLFLDCKKRVEEVEQRKVCVSFG